MRKRIDYRFRVTVYSDSLEALLIDYIRSKDTELTEQDMVMSANCAFWIPLAQKRRYERGFCSEIEFKHSGRMSIYKLLQHIYSLAYICGLEEELVVVPVLRSSQVYATTQQASTDITDEKYTVVNEALLQERHAVVNKLHLDESDNPSARIAEMEIASETPSLLHHADDDVFQTLFRN